MQNLFDLFKNDGRNWYRGNLHTHTTYSDGERTPAETVAWYREAGYDFLFLTEHAAEGGNQLLPDWEKLSTGIAVLPGLELVGLLGVPKHERETHILALGLRGAGVWRPQWSAQRVLDYIRDQGGVSGLAHPYWSGIDDSDLAGLSGAVFVEVYNSTCEAMCDQGVSRAHWDSLLRRRAPIHGAATDDAHWCWDIPDYGMGWVMVKARELSLEAVLRALREGSYYSTTGPSILDVSLDGQEVSVHTSPAIRINFISDIAYGFSARAPSGDTITTARRNLSDLGGFLRIECVDIQGRYAWTNAIMTRP